MPSTPTPTRRSGGVLRHDYLGLDVPSLKRSLANRLVYSVGKDNLTAEDRDWLFALSYAVRDRLIERWMETMRSYYRKDVKRVYYLSLEFLIGRTLFNSLLNMGFLDEARRAMRELGLDLDTLREIEPDAALGNGGLGRLAACFLDSMATLRLPGYGYGIRYEYGMFRPGPGERLPGRAPGQLAALWQPMGVRPARSAVLREVRRPGGALPDERGRLYHHGPTPTR